MLWVVLAVLLGGVLPVAVGRMIGGASAAPPVTRSAARPPARGCQRSLRAGGRCRVRRTGAATR
jgi:hypothetical protein